MQATPPTITGFLADSFFFGVTNFSMTGDFLQTGVSPFALTSTSGYTYVASSFLSFTKRSCSAGTPYYYSADSMCYASCPVATFANTTYNYCQSCDAACWACVNLASNCTPCDASCLTCAGSATNCTSCDSAKHLVKSGGQCICSGGYYYDTMAANCLACNATLTACTACTDSTSCSACTPPTALSAGQCVCSSGEYISGSTCLSCAAVVPGCTACTSGSVCTSCNGTLNWQLNASNLC